MSTLVVKRIWIEKSECTGHALCIPEAPGLLEFDRTGDTSIVKQRSLGYTQEELAQFLAAAEVCPMRAFRIETEAGRIHGAPDDRAVRKALKHANYRWSAAVAKPPHPPRSAHREPSEEFMTDHRGEISVGPDEWLPSFDLEGRYETAVEIDFLIRGASEIWMRLETQCVAECCGIDAFEFWPEDVQKAAEHLDVASAIQALARLRSSIENLSAEVFLSHRMNSYFDKRQLVMLLDHLLKEFRNVPES